METLTDKKTGIWMALMKFGAKVGCHQLPGRSFSYKGYQFPLCARCTGVVLGEMFSIIAIFCTIRLDLICSFALVVPLAVDGGLQHIEICESNNIRRILTGVLAGFGLTYIYYYIIVSLIFAVAHLFM